MNCCKNISIAAKNCHLDCIKHLIDLNFKWDCIITYYAACEGRLDILQYAQEKNFPFHSLTTACAERGSLDCLRFCLEHNHPWQYDYHYAYRLLALERITTALILDDPWWTTYILNLD